MSYSEYLGILLIFISSVFASLRWEGRFSPINKTAIFSLLLGGILFAIASVLLKQSVDGNDFSETQVLSIRALGLFISAGIPMFSLKNVSDLNKFFKHNLLDSLFNRNLTGVANPSFRISDLANKESNRILEMQKILKQVGVKSVSSKNKL